MELFGWKKMRLGAETGPGTGNGLKITGNTKIAEPGRNKNAFCRQSLQGHENQVFLHPPFARAFGRMAYACTIKQLCVPFHRFPCVSDPAGETHPVRERDTQEG